MQSNINQIEEIMKNDIDSYKILFANGKDFTKEDKIMIYSAPIVLKIQIDIIVLDDPSTKVFNIINHVA